MFFLWKITTKNKICRLVFLYVDVIWYNIWYKHDLKMQPKQYNFVLHFSVKLYLPITKKCLIMSTTYTCGIFNNVMHIKYLPWIQTTKKKTAHKKIIADRVICTAQNNILLYWCGRKQSNSFFIEIWHLLNMLRGSHAAHVLFIRIRPISGAGINYTYFEYRF